MLQKKLVVSGILATTVAVATVTLLSSISSGSKTIKPDPPKVKVKVPEPGPWAELCLGTVGLMILGRKFVKQF